MQVERIIGLGVPIGTTYHKTQPRLFANLFTPNSYRNPFGPGLAPNETCFKELRVPFTAAVPPGAAMADFLGLENPTRSFSTRLTDSLIPYSLVP